MDAARRRAQPLRARRCWPRCAAANRSGCSTRCWSAAFIEARSHERLALLARGFADGGDGELADFYAALATAEERHAEIFIELARPLLPAADGDARIDELALREAEILAALPHASRSTEPAPRQRWNTTSPPTIVAVTSIAVDHKREIGRLPDGDAADVGEADRGGGDAAGHRERVLEARAGQARHHAHGAIQRQRRAGERAVGEPRASARRR